MKATDLMIGDYARVNRDGLCIKEGSVVVIRGIEADDKLKLEGKCLVGGAHCHPLDEEQLDGGIWCEYLDPIPLTAKILDKNGFHYNNPNDLPIWDGWEQYGLLLYQSGKGYAINCGTNVAMEINAVNDLQHALRLCGIEKEIEL